MTKSNRGISRLQMTRITIGHFFVIFSCVTLAMEKITNLTMNFYILLNSKIADGFRDPLRGSLNPFAVLEFSKLMYYHNST